MRRANYNKNKDEATREGRQLLADIAHISGLPEGQNFLRFLMDHCGFHNYGTDAKTDGEIPLNNLIHNEALRGVWVTVRRYIPRHNLIPIELPEPPPADQHTEDEDDGN